MKTLIGAGLFFVSTLSHALGVSCGGEKVTYRLESKAHFDICPMGNTSLNIYATSIGGNYHTCNFEAVAKKVGDEHYVAVDGGCEISFTISGGQLNPIFGENCRAFCGVRANWRAGTYIE